jgi:hypothetical protein
MAAIQIREMGMDLGHCNVRMRRSSFPAEIVLHAVKALVATLANGRAIGCAPRLATIRPAAQHISR